MERGYECGLPKAPLRGWEEERSARGSLTSQDPKYVQLWAALSHEPRGHREKEQGLFFSHVHFLADVPPDQLRRYTPWPQMSSPPSPPSFSPLKQEFTPQYPTLAFSWLYDGQTTKCSQPAVAKTLGARTRLHKRWDNCLWTEAQNLLFSGYISLYFDIFHNRFSTQALACVHLPHQQDSLLWYFLS